MVAQNDKVREKQTNNYVSIQSARSCWMEFGYQHKRCL